MLAIDFTRWYWTFTNDTSSVLRFPEGSLQPGETRVMQGTAPDNVAGAKDFLDSYNVVAAAVPARTLVTVPALAEALRQAHMLVDAYRDGSTRLIVTPEPAPVFDPAAKDGPLDHIEDASDLADRRTIPSNADVELDRLPQANMGELPPTRPARGSRHVRSGDETAAKTTGADPVDLFTGEFFLEIVDFALPSVGLPFVFMRTYKSGRTFFGPFGYNWDHNYNVYLRPLTSGALAVNTGRLHEDVYTDSGDSANFDAPRGVFSTLHREALGAAYAYVLTWPGGTTWKFAVPVGWSDPERVPLVVIEDRHGNAQQLEYGLKDLLVAVIDTVGRRIEFVYGNCDRLEALRPSFLQKAGAAPVEIQYLHAGDAEHLVGVVTMPTPDFPSGLTTEYEYDETQLFGEQRGNILRVIDAKGQVIVENSYGIDPGDPGYNRVVKQYFDGGEYLFDYMPLRFVPPYDELVNDAAVQVTLYEPERPLKVYTFNFRGDLLDERYRLCADGSYRVWAQAYRYTARGLLAERYYPDGLAELFTYDEANPNPLARGLLLQVNQQSQRSRTVKRFTYEPRFQRIKSITDEAGRTVTFFYDYERDPFATRGNMERIVSPTVTLPDGTTQGHCETTFRYDARGQLLEQRSPEGRTTSFTFHLTGAGAGLPGTLSRDTGSGSAITEAFEYDALGHLRRHVDGRGNDTLLEHNLLGQLVRAQLPLVNGRRASFKFEYNEDRLVAKEYVPRGAYSDTVIHGEWIQHLYEYDVTSRLRRATRNVNTLSPQLTIYDRDVHGRVRRVTDPLGITATIDYDERDLPLRHQRFADQPFPLTTSYQYDRSGRLIRTRTDGAEHRFDYSDPFGRLKAKINPVGVKMTFAYGPRDEVASTMLTDAAGLVLQATQYHYDERGRLIGHNLNGLTHTFFRDRDDLVTRTVDHRGSVTRFTYDGLGRVASVEDPQGTRATLTLDANGNRTSAAVESISPATGSLVRFEEHTAFDARNRLISAIDRFGNVVQQALDDRDLRSEVTDTQGHKVRTLYDVNGLTTRTAILASGVERTVRRWHRDMLGRLMAFEDADGNLTRYDYDMRSNVARITYPDGSTVEKTYDPLNALASEKDPNGSVVTFAYDTVGRVTDVRVQPGPGVAPTPDLQRAYDAFGRVRLLTQGTRTVEFTYDAFNRLIKEKQGAFMTQRRYDDARGRVTLVYSDGREDMLQLDANGRVTDVSFQKVGADGLLVNEFAEGTALLRYTYDGIRLVEGRYANGVVASYDYDQDAKQVGRDLTDSANRLIDREQRIFDGEKRVRLSARTPTLSQHTVYSYDDLSRLIEMTTLPGTLPLPAATSARGTGQATLDAFVANVGQSNPSRRERYVLTLNDRRVSWEIDGGVFTPIVNGLQQLTQLQAPGGAVDAFSYDRNGNRTSDSSFTYRYDAFDRLVTATDTASGLPVLQLSYDPVGRVVERWENGVTTHFVFDGSRAIEERIPGSVVQHAFGTGIDELLVTSRTGLNVFSHVDELGSVKALTDGNGSLLAVTDFSAFGTPFAFDAAGQAMSWSAAPLSPRFAGHPFLESVALYDCRARVYDPATGSFLQRDAASYSDSSNPYLYCRHNPIGAPDPSGRIVPVVVGIVAAAALGAGAGGIFGSIRQGLQIASGYMDEYGNVKEDFDWNELGVNIGIGGALGMGIVLFPPVAGVLIALGAVGGATEIANGNRAVGSFDIATSVFSAKGTPKFFGTTVASRFGRVGLETLLSLEGIKLQTNLAFMRLFGFHQARFESAFASLTRTPELRVALEYLDDPGFGTGLRTGVEFSWGPGFQRNKNETAGEVDVLTDKVAVEVKTGVDFLSGLTTAYRTAREFIYQRVGDVEHLGQLDKLGMFFPEHCIHLWIRPRYFKAERVNNGETQPVQDLSSVRHFVHACMRTR